MTFNIERFLSSKDVEKCDLESFFLLYKLFLLGVWKIVLSIDNLQYWYYCLNSLKNELISQKKNYQGNG